MRPAHPDRHGHRGQGPVVHLRAQDDRRRSRVSAAVGQGAETGVNVYLFTWD